MKKLSANYEQGLKDALADPNEAAAYLNAALEDESPDVFLMALRDVANAQDIMHLAHETSVNRENLYRVFSERGNPQFSNLKALLDSLGLALAVEPKRAAA